MSTHPKAIIVGASSGIGAALARLLSEQGYHVGLAARRQEKLKALADSLDGPSSIAVLDVTQTDTAIASLEKLISALGEIDLFIFSSGVGFENPDLDMELELDTVAVNVRGFTAIINVVAHQLEAQQHGTLVGLSSLAAIRGNGGAPAYGASKAYMSNYLQGLQHKFAKLKMSIQVLDVQPGFVDTDMAKGENLFWVAPPEKAALQIYKAIKKGKHHTYITKRWRLIAWVLNILPNWLYHRL